MAREEKPVAGVWWAAVVVVAPCVWEHDDETVLGPFVLQSTLPDNDGLCGPVKNVAGCVPM